MKRFTKIWLIAATSLILIGVILFGGVMVMLNWDFSKLSTVKYETNTYEITETFHNVSIETQTATVVFLPTDNKYASVVCHEQTNVKHSVAVQDSTLVIKTQDSRKWYEHIGINLSTPKITVYIPQGQSGILNIHATTGNIRIENLSIDGLDLSVTTGDITLSNVTARGNIQFKSTTGIVSICNVGCQNLTGSGSTGHVRLTNVIVKDAMTVNRTTADIQLNQCDAGELYLKTCTGDIRCTLLSEKVFIASTTTGNINVPQTTTGGRCELATTTGDIRIEITKG